MYFIPRNNAIYNYIAHTNMQRRYIATLFVFALATATIFYGVYKPLESHLLLYKSELERLQQQSVEASLTDKNNKETTALIEATKQSIGEHVVEENKREEYCSQQMQFVFDAIAKQGLSLSAYGPCKEKDKKWYIKDSAHCQIVGSLEKVVSFLKVIKESEKMIRLSHLAITRVKDNEFQLSCDVGIITVKK